MQSENTIDIDAALAKAQGTMEAAKLNKIVNFSGRTYKYADLCAVIEAIRKPLADNNLALTQTTEIREGGFVLVTTLRHGGSGQWIASEHPLPLAGKPQDLGSAMTYAKRYSITSLLCIAADEDDDGEAAQQNGLTASTPAAKEPPVYAKTTEEYNERTKADLDRGRTKPAAVEPPVHPVTGEAGPHAIVEDNDMKWGAKFVAAIKAAKTNDEINEWIDLNSDRLNVLSLEGAKIHDRIMANIDTASEALKRTAA